MYIGHPDVIRVDQESAFTSPEFETLANRNGINIQLLGVQSHNAIGVEERYHSPLRRIFEKIFEEVPNIDPHWALQLAVKSMNDTVGPDGLVPSMLVFGVMPRFPPIRADLPKHEERMRAIQVARTEMTEIVARQKIQLASRAKIPPAVEYSIRPDDKVFVHDEKKRRWIGPFEVEKTFDELVWIRRHDGIKRYPR